MRNKSANREQFQKETKHAKKLWENRDYRDANVKIEVTETPEIKEISKK